MMVLAPALIALALQSAGVARALEAVETGDHARAAALLDEADGADPAFFERNNLAYLRGRIAEMQGDWDRAGAEFERIDPGGVLGAMAAFHAARAAIEMGRDETAIEWLDRLPSGFPARLRMALADGASDGVALRVYDGIDAREAEAGRALLRNDTPALWRLLEGRQNDEPALEAAVHLHVRAPTLSAEQRMLLARTLHGHRVFERAAALYRSLLEDAEYGEEANFELARTYFQRTRYDDAIEAYRQTARRFPGTDRALEAEIQIASSHWRQPDLEAAEAAYLALIRNTDNPAGDPDDYQEFVRDLVDVYRSLGRTADALEWIERALARQPRAATRAVLTFTRGKIHYHAGRFDDALADFRELGNLPLRAVPNGTDRDEARFLEALALEGLGRVEDARAIWTDLAGNPFSYYGLHALDRLDDATRDGKTLQEAVWEAVAAGSVDRCRRASHAATRAAADGRNRGRARGFRMDVGESEGALVEELLFLGQWEEAYFWAGIDGRTRSDAELADLAFAAGDFRRAMLYADRIRPPDDALFVHDGQYDAAARALMDVLYPAAYADALCLEAASAGVDPLWLRSIMYQESRYDPSARSVAAARGLMQFIPETAAAVAERAGMGPMTPARMYTPEVSIRLGARYWSELMAEFGRPDMALAAYNGGPHNVRRWAAKSPVADPILFLSDIGFVQTKDYVSRVFGLYAMYLHLQ